MTEPVRKRDLPFPRHWLGYIAIKIAVVAAAVFIALSYWDVW